MLEFLGDPAEWLPVTFAVLMGVSILVYVVLDGFDLGVGLLFPFSTAAERDRMVASIGPFWDANETWLVLAIGLLLVAFPAAHGKILTALYLPVFIMLIGLILRGVAFEFRAKDKAERKPMWNRAFFWGSLMTSISQGFMLGLYIMGLTWDLPSVAFAFLTGLCLTGAYAFIGAAWLILKTDGALQEKSVDWARRGLTGILVGLGAVSIATPFVSTRIFEKWFSFPEILLLAPLPVGSLVLIGILYLSLKSGPHKNGHWSWVPFAATMGVFTLGFLGMAYSFYPYVVPEALTIYDAASAPESLMIILAGVFFVLPAILGYTALSYYVFRGKATELRYD